MTLEDFENITNDRAAYEELYVDYFIKLYKYGKKFTANTALIEDSVQDVFLDIWVKKQKLSQAHSINSYLFASFRYILLRKLKEGNKIISGEETEPQFSIEYRLINQEANNELQRKLKTALDRLTSHQREAIFLRFYQYLSHEEVANILHISVKATYKLLARSLAVLKESMLVVIAFLLHLFSSKSFF